jgi:hypothetical protein
MLFIDESALATDGVTNLVLDGSGSLMVEVSGIVADETFDDDFPDSPTVNVIDGDVVSISYDTDVLRDAEFVLGQGQADTNDWFCAGGGPCDDALVVTYSLERKAGSAPVPEPLFPFSSIRTDR